ncbi:DinB family protein [Sporosarcina sp. ITBMC105]
MSLLKQMKFARVYTLGWLQQAQEEAWDVQPEGFNNTIRWHVGHIFMTMETLVKKAVPTYEIEHEEWIPLFAPGSCPAKWEGDVPGTEVLIAALSEQTERLAHKLDEKLEDVLESPMKIGELLEMNTVEGVVEFVVWHEGVHTGIIHALIKLTEK